MTSFATHELKSGLQNRTRVPKRRGILLRRIILHHHYVKQLRHPLRNRHSSTWTCNTHKNHPISKIKTAMQVINNRFIPKHGNSRRVQLDEVQIGVKMMKNWKSKTGEGGIFQGDLAIWSAAWFHASQLLCLHESVAFVYRQDK